MTRATVTSKGQITIPKRIRDELGLDAGDGVEFTVDEEGRLVGTPIGRSEIVELAGSLSHLAGSAPVTLAEMEAAVRKKAAQRSRGEIVSRHAEGAASDR